MPPMTPPVPLPSFGASLRHWRRTQNLSQAGLGELLTPRVCHSAVSRWENGSRVPSGEALRQLILLTGISPSIALGLPSPELDQESA